jgi:hypothetical protein
MIDTRGAGDLPVGPRPPRRLAETATTARRQNETGETRADMRGCKGARADRPRAQRRRATGSVSTGRASVEALRPRARRPVPRQDVRAVADDIPASSRSSGAPRAPTRFGAPVRLRRSRPAVDGLNAGIARRKQPPSPTDGRRRGFGRREAGRATAEGDRAIAEGRADRANDDPRSVRGAPLVGCLPGSGARNHDPRQG